MIVSVEPDSQGRSFRAPLLFNSQCEKRFRISYGVNTQTAVLPVWARSSVSTVSARGNKEFVLYKDIKKVSAKFHKYMWNWLSIVLGKVKRDFFDNNWNLILVP